MTVSAAPCRALRRLPPHARSRLGRAQEFYHSMKHKVVQSAFNVREKLAPVRSTSGFEDHGVLTPEEARASTHTRTHLTTRLS